MTADEREGVIKFDLSHRKTELPAWTDTYTVALSAWREILRRLDMVGVDPRRYDGLGFGNISCRVPPWSNDPANRGNGPRFLITGSQTGRIRRLSKAHIALVERCDIAATAVDSVGLCPPSSESTTHATIYRLGAHIRWVFHAHSPDIWQHGQGNGWPTTGTEVSYGTPQMAAEVRRLWRTSTLSVSRILIMAGHQDGVVTFGRTPEECMTPLIGALSRSLM